MIRHKKIPASLHFEKANPQIDFEKTPFFVNTQLNEWKSNKTPLRAGVSSFGIGGTNAHVILEECLVSPSTPSKGSEHYLFPFSAKNPQAMKRLITRLIKYLKHDPAILSDIAYTLQVGRTALPYRRFVVSSSIVDLLNQLQQFNEDKGSTKLDIESQEQNFETLLAKLKKLRQEAAERKLILQAIGKLWQAGNRIPWGELYDHQSLNARVPLPTYPFSKTEYRKEAIPNHSSRDVSSSLFSNRSLAEVMVATVWRDLLHVESIAVNANFFELGGDSLSALEMLSQLRLFFNIEIPLRKFLIKPILNELVAELETAMSERKLSMGI